MRIAHFWLLVIAALCIAGCKKQPEYNEADLNKTVIKLSSPGSEPKRQLRYKFQAGRADSVSMELKMGMDAGIPGLGVGEIDIPKISMLAEIKCLAISDQGDLTYSIKVSKVEVDGAGKKKPLDLENIVGDSSGVDPDELLKELQSMEGTETTETVTPRGFSAETKGKSSAIGNQLKKISGNAMMQPEENLWVPFPEEPIGKGAQWTASRLMRENGILFTQSMTYELVELQGDKGKVRLTLKQVAPEQEFVSPDMPAGAKAEIEKLDSKGSGEMAFDLTRPVTQMELQMDISMVILVKAQGQRVRARPKVSMKAWFKPREAAAESAK